MWSQHLENVKNLVDSMRLVVWLNADFVAANLSRRRWHSSSKYKKTIWQCVESTKDGKGFVQIAKAFQSRS